MMTRSLVQGWFELYVCLGFDVSKRGLGWAWNQLFLKAMDRKPDGWTLSLGFLL